MTYNSEGFVDKNKDLLFHDFIELASISNSRFIPNLFPENASVADKKRPTTAGFKIKVLFSFLFLFFRLFRFVCCFCFFVSDDDGKKKTSIQSLVDTLSKCHPHYIRCIKPNERKQRNLFENDLVQHQVRYLGLLENVRVRRAGFAFRQFYDKFFYRFRVCSEATWPRWDGDMKAGCTKILEIMHLEGKAVAYGKTKVFIRAPETIFSLEEMRERKVQTYANRIQRFFLRFALRRYFWEIQVAGNNAYSVCFPFLSLLSFSLVHRSSLFCCVCSLWFH